MTRNLVAFAQEKLHYVTKPIVTMPCQDFPPRPSSSSFNMISDLYRVYVPHVAILNHCE